MVAHNRKKLQRLAVVIGAALMQSSFGGIYAWYFLAPALFDQSGKHGLSTTQVHWIFSTALLFIAGAAVFTGKLVDRFSPRSVAVASGILFGSGFIFTAFFGCTFPLQLIFIGLVAGCGVGLGCVIPIAVGFNWFPDNKGIMAGFAAAVFALGALIWIKSADTFIAFSLLGLDGVRSGFLLFGILCSILVLIGSIGMVNPASGYFYPGSKSSVFVSEINSHQLLNVFKTPQFSMLWGSFLFSSLAGLIVIGLIGPFGFNALKASGLESRLAAQAALWATASSAVLCGLGCLVWGSLSDNAGRKGAILIMCLLQAATMLLLSGMGSDPKLLILAACIIGFNLGGNFSLFPAITADYFGGRKFHLHYGLILSACSVAGIAGLCITAWFKTAAQDNIQPPAWGWAFTISGILCLVSAVLIFFAGRPSGSRRS